MPNVEDIKRNIVDYCGNSEERMSILKEVKKPSHYATVAKRTGVYRTTCSAALKAMVPLELVEEIGKHKGIYRQTPIVRGLNIDSVIRAAARETRIKVVRAPTSREVRTIKVPTPDIEKILDDLKVERAIKRDCFPLRQPYRKDVGEAYLTLENVMKDELGIQHARNMMDVVAQARATGLFKRTEQSEEDGLGQLFNASALWLRNPPHHRKDVIPKDDALKMILFADYLIKLVKHQKKLNKIK